MLHTEIRERYFEQYLRFCYLKCFQLECDKLFLASSQQIGSKCGLSFFSHCQGIPNCTIYALCRLFRPIHLSKHFDTFNSRYRILVAIVPNFGDWWKKGKLSEQRQSKNLRAEREQQKS